MKRSNAAALAIATSTLLVALTACGTSTSSDTPSSEEDAGPIHILLSTNPAWDPLRKLVDAYVKDTGREVDVQSLAQQQMSDKALLNLQSRSNGMDVYMTLPSREGPQFSSAGYYEPLDPFLAKASDDYDAAGFSESALAGMNVNGDTIAMPLAVEGPVMYYRTDLFEQAGLKPPATVDDLLDDAAVLKQKFPDVTPVALRGQSGLMAYTFGPVLHAQGIEWTKDGKPNFDNDKAVKAIDQYATLGGKFGPSGVANYTDAQSVQLFTSGMAAVLLESSTYYTSILDPSSSTVADKFGVANFPGGAKGSTPSTLSWGLAISPFSAHKQAAWDFIEWVTSPSSQLSAALEGAAPPRPSLFDDDSYVASLSSEPQKQWRDALIYILAHGNTEIGPVGTQAPQMRVVIGDAIDKVMLGQATAKEAADQIQQGLAPLLDGK